MPKKILIHQLLKSSINTVPSKLQQSTLRISINIEFQKSSSKSFSVPEKPNDLVPEKLIDLVPEKLNYRWNNKKSEQTLVFCADFNDLKPVLKRLCSRPVPARLFYSSMERKQP